jgi:NAD(P)-dependent dehydrogenase (short-subunit alcohol dehydrogenase family)
MVKPQMRAENSFPRRCGFGSAAASASDGPMAIGPIGEKVVGQFDGRTILITGAAGATGARVTQALRAAGGRVIGVDQAAAIGADEMILADIGGRAAIEALCRSIAGRTVDILINLAGLVGAETAERAIAQLWAGYTTGLIAPAMIARALLPGMTARGHGQIVTVGAPFGDTPLSGFVKWSSAKAGLKGLSEALRGELAGSGVVVTHIDPRGRPGEGARPLADRIVDAVVGCECAPGAGRPLAEFRASPSC